MEEARKRLALKKKIKESVLIIERARYRQLHRRELKMLRSYLKRLPYECRGVYFKFMEVKKTQNEIVHQF